MITRDDPGVAWLLTSGEPAVRMLTLLEVLGESPDHPEVVAAREAFLSGPVARALLDEHGERVYGKWRGPFWRLTALVELGVPAGEPTASGYLRAVLAWLNDMEQHGYPPIIAGRARAHAVWHGHALAAAIALNWTDKSAAAALAEQLIQWQWPDGGWNCDRRPDASCASVHESLGPLWGLAAYHRATGDPAAGEAVRRAAEFFLERRLFRSRGTGQIIDPKWLQFRHPAYYHYDVLQALWVLGRAGYLHDTRVDDALELVASRRRTDGRWNANGRWWKPPGQSGSNVEAADWGSSQPSVLVTLKALTAFAFESGSRAATSIPGSRPIRCTAWRDAATYTA
jgi:hypothetical protein